MINPPEGVFDPVHAEGREASKLYKKILIRSKFLGSTRSKRILP